MRRGGLAAVRIGLLVVAVGLLAGHGPSRADLPGSPGAVWAWLAASPYETRLAAIAGTAAWACLGWLALCAGLAVAGRIRGAPGEVARAAHRALTPACLRGIASVLLGAAVSASSPAAYAEPRPAPAATASPSPGGPFERPAEEAAPPPSPVTPAPTPTSTPTLAMAPAGPAPVLAPGPREPVDPAVVVHRGDTLWAIAARHLPAEASAAQIDAAWRRWWSANRAVVGADPNLIFPGQLLVPPPPTT